MTATLLEAMAEALTEPPLKQITFAMEELLQVQTHVLLVQLDTMSTVYQTLLLESLCEEMAKEQGPKDETTEILPTETAAKRTAPELKQTGFAVEAVLHQQTLVLYALQASTRTI